MDFSIDHIRKLCEELHELGIDINPRTMGLILESQDFDFRNSTEHINPALEYDKLINLIKNHNKPHN